MGVRGSRYEGSDESDNGTVEVNQNDSIHTHKMKADRNGVLQQPSSINEVVGPSVQLPLVTEDDGKVLMSPSVTDCQASHVMFDVRLVNTGSKKMREAALKMNRFPETVRELKEALEGELQIPMYDQVVIFGSEQLDDKKKIEFRVAEGRPTFQADLSGLTFWPDLQAGTRPERPLIKDVIRLLNLINLNNIIYKYNHRELISHTAYI